MPPNLSTPIAILAVCAALILGIYIGVAVESKYYNNYLNKFKTIRQTSDPYKLVAPLVGIDSPSALTIGRFAEVESEIKRYAREHKELVDSFGIYYRDLNSSQWYGVNEDERFIPASLLKIALAFAVLKQEEDDPSFASAVKVYTQEIANINSSAPFLEHSNLVVGKAYKTNDLLLKMLIDSDNGAKDLLYSEVDKRYFKEVFSLLNVTDPFGTVEYQLSPKDYALFFRMLYGGTYLSAENSQKLLEILTKTQFGDGLVAGVHQPTIIAHKYGTFTLADQEGSKVGIELHDCGIIYHPEHPYLLCIMTKGGDAKRLATFISEVSSIVYKSVEELAQ